MTIDLPESTRVHKELPLKVLFKTLSLTKALRNKFASEVDSIFVENCLSMDSLRLGRESEIEEIIILSINLKAGKFDGKVLEAIARQNTHELVFLLSYGEERQLAIYHGKLYRSPWMPEDQVSLSAQGFTLAEIRDSFIEQIALTKERAEQTDTLSIGQRLNLQDKINKLEKLIEKTEAALWKEIQPKKQFSLHQRLQKHKQQLEDLKRGQT